MDISIYTEKLNKVDGNIYVIEEMVQLTDDVYEAPLAHDNVNTSTLAVWTGPKLTGDRIQTYALSTPSLTPWKRVIRLYADVPVVYISYETDGDTVEAEDINLVQGDLVRTQKGVNDEETRAEAAEEVLRADLTAEEIRAKNAEKKLCDDLAAETVRATGAEKTLTDNLAAEVTRAKAKETELQKFIQAEAGRAEEAEKALYDNLTAEVNRAKAREDRIAADLVEESTRARDAEAVLTDNLTAETVRAEAKEAEISGNLSSEITRAKAEEKTLTNNLTTEVTRAKGAEETLTDNLASEVTRAKAAEKINSDAVSAEVIRAKAKEKELQGSITAEASRASAAENAIRGTISTNKPNWDDKYTRNEVDNKFSALETAIDWKEAVATYADIAITYPVPQDGWTVNVKDTDYTYRYSGTTWIAISANAIPKATQSVDGLLSKEDKAALDDTNAKKHSHSNKSTLDKLTETLLTNWTDAYNKRHEHGNKTVIDKITQTLLDNWSAAYAHISNKSNPHGVTKAQAGLGNVPNVATNDQTPTFTQAASLTNIVSGEKLTVMLGKIAKALVDFIAHKADMVIHITGAERTNWNDANSKKHSHSNKTVIDKITQALLDNWSAAYTHVSDAVKHITASERSNWNAAHTHISNKGNPHGVTAAQAGAAPTSHTHTKSQITDMPTKVSQFTNDAGYITQADVDMSQNHTHANKIVLDKITQALLDNWNAAYTHVSDAVKHVTAAERTNWNTVTNKVDKVSGKQLSTNDYTTAEKNKLAGIAAGANNYVHPTTTGNKHIPTGGVSGQFLKWSADGTAVWAADNNTTYSVFKAATSTAAGGTGLVPAPAAGAQAKYLRADGTWQTPPNTSYSVATQTANGLMAAADKKKLDGVAAGANNYVHPSSHPGSIITQDATHRFTTDTEKAGWNKILFSAAVIVPVSGWSTSVPYTQTVSVSGLTAAMDVMLGLNITGSPSAASVAGWKKALGMIDEGTTANGTITFKCYSKKPTVDIPVFIKSV